MVAISRSTHFSIGALFPMTWRHWAHATELAKAGFLSASDLAAVESALTEISEEFDSGDLHPSATDEDVHGALERILIEKVGPQAGEHSVLAGAATIRLPHSSGSTCAIARNS